VFTAVRESFRKEGRASDIPREGGRGSLLTAGAGVVAGRVEINQ